jgi:hypothetical protein
VSAAREITLDELPRHSPWPARLLGLEAAGREPRTAASVLREYDRDKYAPLLAAVEREPGMSVEDVKRLELGDPGTPVVMSEGDRLLLVPAAEAVRRSVDTVTALVAEQAAGAGAVVDLGCGYGYQLAQLAPVLPGVRLLGGEYAPSAVALAGRLHAGDGIAVEEFDFLAGRPGPLARAENALVLLSYVLTTVPDVAAAVELLAAQRERIGRVVVFDADRSLFGDGLLGLLRRRYVEVNDYRCELLDVLRARTDVTIERVDADVIGPNALLPASVIVFRFEP